MANKLSKTKIMIWFKYASFMGTCKYLDLAKLEGLSDLYRHKPCGFSNLVKL